MRRGTLIAILVMLLLIGIGAAFQIAAFNSEQRPPAPTPSASPSQP